MDILFISKYILVIALIIMMLASLRASAYKSTSMGLLGSSYSNSVCGWSNVSKDIFTIIIYG